MRTMEDGESPETFFTTCFMISRLMEGWAKMNGYLFICFYLSLDVESLCLLRLKVRMRNLVPYAGQMAFLSPLNNSRFDQLFISM